MKSNRFKAQAGFTLIEVIIVVLLIGLAAALVLPRGLREAADAAAVDSEAQKLAGLIRLAGQQARVRKMTYTVSISATHYTVVSADGRVDGRPVSRDGRIEVQNVPDMKIEFSAGGLPARPVTVVLRAAGGDGQVKTIEINRLGIVNIR